MPADTNAFKYVGFQDRFRGSRDEVRARLAAYVPLFAGAANVVDLGCGRGEMLELLREHGITARGVDVNDDMVAACRTQGFEAEHADALAFLEAQADQSVGGVVAIQVVEHLEPDYLMRLLETAHHKLQIGGTMVLETINVACWAAFFDSFLRDLTHTRALHPDTLKYFVQVSGFSSIEVRFLSPVADHDRLPSVRLPTSEVPTAVDDIAEALNAHADRLNQQLFTHRDYAIVGRK